MLPEIHLPILQAYQPQRGSFYQLWMGIRFFWIGWSLFWQSHRLKWISLIPILLTLLIFSGFSYLSIRFADVLIAELPTTWPNWIKVLLDGLGSLLATFISIIFLYLFFFPIMSVISGPFREALAVETERLIVGQSPKAADGSILIMLRDTIQMLLFQIVILLGTLALGWFVPVVGPFISLLVLMYVAGFDMIDPALSIRGYHFQAKLKFVQDHLDLMAGFGMVAFLLLGIPVLNLLILPMGSIGGAVLVLSSVRSNPQATD